MEQKRRTFRTWTKKIHLWVGVVAGLLFCVMGLSGAILAFRPQIEAALEPKVHRPAGCEAFDADKAIAALEEYAHGAPNRIVFPSKPDRPVTFQLRKPYALRLAYDPCSNRVLGAVNVGWLDWITDLHHNLLAGKIGRTVVGAIGIALLLSSLSGALVWITAARRRGVWIEWRLSKRRIVFDLHRSTGILALVPALVQACTGIALAYPQFVHLTLDHSHTEGLKPKQQKKGTHQPSSVTSVANLIALAQRAIPDGTIREVRGLSDSQEIEVRFWRAGDLRESATNIVHLNAAGTRVHSVVLSRDQTAANRLLQTLTAIHYGEWGGIASRVLLGLCGPALTVLFLSGFLIRWWPRSSRQNARANAQKKDLAAV